MTWTFPIQQVPLTAPSVPQLRQFVRQALQGIATQVRQGGCPVNIAPAPAVPVGGWNHWHPWPELFLQLVGASHFTTPVGELTVTSGTCLVMPPLFAHNEHCNLPADSFCNVVFTLFDRRLTYHLALLDRTGAHVGRPRVAQPDLIEPADYQLGLASLMGLSKAGDVEDARAGWLLAFCTWAINAIAAAPPTGFTGSERVRRTQELVHARLGSPQLSVVQLGAWLGCHHDHLARLFRHETGETVVGHIRRLRLERARDLLADRTLRIADVARLVGLPDPAYFSRIYRQAYGIPPAAARRAVLGQVRGP